MCGLAGALPAATLFERALEDNAHPGLGVEKGLLVTLVSFLVLITLTYLVHLGASGLTLPFGCAMAGAFLAFWGVESLRGWRAAQAACLAEGKDER